MTKYMRPYAGWIALGIGCSAAEAIFELLIPLVMSDIVDVGIATGDQGYILRKGIFVTGGSSRIPGLIEYMEQAFELPLTPLYDGENSVALGGAKFLDDRQLLGNLLGIKLD